VEEFIAAMTDGLRLGAAAGYSDSEFAAGVNLRPGPSPWPRALNGGCALFVRRSLGAGGWGQVTRYRSATVAGSHGVPRPLHTHVSGREAISNNESQSMARRRGCQ